MLLLNNISVRRLSGAIAAGTTDQTVTFDSLGFRSVMVAIAMGTITGGAVTSAKLQHGDKSDGSDAANITGCTVTIPDTASNKLFLLEVQKPTKRYITVYLDRGTANAAVEGIVALIQDDRVNSVLQDDTVSASIQKTDA